MAKFWVSQHGSVALITMDNELAEYRSKFELPVVRVQDVISQHIDG